MISIPSALAGPAVQVNQSLSQKSRSSLDSQGRLTEADKSRSALAAATAQSAPLLSLRGLGGGSCMEVRPAGMVIEFGFVHRMLNAPEQRSPSHLARSPTT